MKTIRLYHALMTFLSLALTLPGFSQSMSNTDNMITLTNTCLNAGVANGTYNLELQYYDNDAFTTKTVTYNGVGVSVVNGVMTITAPPNSFPAVSNNGWWSLPDAWPGHIKLTSGSFVVFLDWYQNPDGTLGINCIPLPVWFSSFTVTGGNFQATLNWTTDMEQNSTYIEIWRATTNSASAFYKIGQVTAQGNSSIQHSYTFTDPHPCSSNYYYLKMLNSQGTPPIFSNTVPFTCSGCSCTLPSPVYCNYTINGPDHVCNLETPTAFSLSTSIPNYSTISWSVDVPSAVSLQTYPNFDKTKVTLLKKNTTAAVTLQASLSGCTNVITKVIAMGAPMPDITSDQECPDIVCWPASAPGATSYLWQLTDVVRVRQTFSTGSSFSAYIGDGSLYDVGLQYTNACGTSPWYTVGNLYCEPGQSQSIRGGTINGSINPISIANPGSVVWPNPTSGVMTVMLPVVATATQTAQPKIYQLRVMDLQGIQQKNFSYPGGVDKASVNITGLAAGIYMIQIFDNQRWVTKRVILTK
ncbi:MAG TPA: T9SS type A sorting domain-containing protein [Puia sp.]|nr:T9SS type A sorting domain-containing protein [Puia sp.]